jgi:RNA polymerase-binding protein DksA
MATSAAKKSAPARSTSTTKKAASATKAATKKTSAKSSASTTPKATAPRASTKAASSKATTGKAAPSKTTSKTTTSKTTARKTTTGKATTGKTAGKTAAGRTTSKSTTSKKKVAVKTSPSSAGSAGTAKKSPAAAKPAARKRAEKLTVGAGESPWTVEELDELRGELERDAEHLRSEIHDAEEEIAGLLRDGGDGAGNDQADVGSTTFERDHEMSLANNARDMLSQIERALGRIEDGSYGVCESCGNAIGKGRLQAFPRATLCVSCKEREERR